MQCLFPWTQVYVENDALVKPCCSSIELGNLRDTKLADIPFSTKAQALRTAMGSGVDDDLPRDCIGCYARARLADVHTLERTYPLGENVEKTLRELEKQGHAAFVNNYRAVRKAYENRTQLPPGAKPLGIWGNLGTHCNIRCIMCWQDHVNPLALTDPQVENIKELIPTCHTLQLVGGEPTVYKAFWDLADYFKKHAMPQARFLMLTNGLLLTKEKLDRLHDIEYVTFSVNVDGPTKESYEKIRFGGQWEVLIENLHTISDYVRARKRNHWNLGLAFTLMRSNIDLLVEGIEMAAKFDASWHCGVIFGEHSPVEQCKVFFEENMFRFGHTGVTKDDIIGKLTAALPAARKLHRSPDMAVTCLEATMQYVRSTEQVHIPTERVARMRGIAEKFKLSAEIQNCMTTYLSTAAKPRTINELIQIVGVTRRDKGQQNQATFAAVLELGKGHMAQGQYGEALPHLRHALESYERTLGKDHASTAGAVLELAKCLMSLAKPTEAEPLLRQAHEAYVRALGLNHSVTRAAALELAQCLNGLSKHAEARPLLRQTLDYYESALGRSHSYTIRTVFEFAKCLSALGAPVEAEPLWARAVAYYQAAFGDSHSYTAVAAHELARCRVARGDAAGAEPLLAQVLEYYQGVFGNDHSYTAIAALELGRSRMALGDRTAAMPLLELALDYCQRTLGVQHELTVAIQGELDTCAAPSGSRVAPIAA